MRRRDCEKPEWGRRRVRMDFYMKRRELESISEFGTIFEGNDGIREEIDIGGARRSETKS